MWALFFAYSQHRSDLATGELDIVELPDSLFTSQLRPMRVATYYEYSFTKEFFVDDQSYVTWAQATPVSSPTPAPGTLPASVPGPLPALGGAAAFGFSRKLRKRIKRSTNTVFSPYGN